MYDRLSKPTNRRGETCVNCGKSWAKHSGWSCEPALRPVPFDMLKPGHHYLTESMLDSLPTYPTINASADMDERVYAFFTSPPAGCCPCGIPRTSGRCSYHTK